MKRTQVSNRLFCRAIIGVLLLFFFCATGRQAQRIRKEAGSTGTVRVSGAWALYPMMVRWGEEFRKLYPDVRIDVSAGGAGKGIADALAGMVDIGMVSRDIRPEEIRPGTTYVPVVKDAVFPTINTNNPVVQRYRRKGH